MKIFWLSFLGGILWAGQSGILYGQASSLEFNAGAQYESWDTEEKPRVGTSFQSRYTRFQGQTGYVAGLSLLRSYSRVHLGYGHRVGKHPYGEWSAALGYSPSEGLNPYINLALGGLIKGSAYSLVLTVNVLNAQLEVAPFLGVVF